MIENITWIKCICDKCGASWIPRIIDPLPKQCAYCRSRQNVWNRGDKGEGDGIAPSHVESGVFVGGDGCS